MSARGLLIRTLDSMDQDDIDLIGVSIPFSPGTTDNNESEMRLDCVMFLKVLNESLPGKIGPQSVTEQTSEVKRKDRRNTIIGSLPHVCLYYLSIYLLTRVIYIRTHPHAPPVRPMQLKNRTRSCCVFLTKITRQERTESFLFFGCFTMDCKHF